MFKDELAFGNLYQLIVLISIISLLTMTFFLTGELNEILLGGLLGVMAGLPAKK